MNSLTDLPLDTNYRQAAALDAARIAELKRLLADWDILYEAHTPRLSRHYPFPDFDTALHFANTIGQLAAEANHHPTLLVEWGKLTVIWWTHSLKALHLNDFIMAARCDRVYRELQH